jgi:hypothetical protein
MAALRDVERTIDLLEAVAAALERRAEAAERAWEAENGRANKAEQRAERERERADAIWYRLIDLQAAYDQARSDARASDEARVAAERVHAEASVSLVALSEHLEALEAEGARRSLSLLARLVAMWRRQ